MKKILTQKEKDARTSFWFINSVEATKLINKIHTYKINVSVYTENTLVIVNRNFTKIEYKKLFPIVKSDLL